MKKTPIVVLLVALATLAGCSKLGEQVPNYHTLLPEKGGSYKTSNFEVAMKKCNEASSDAAAEASPWCGIAHKALRCEESGYAAYGGMKPTAASKPTTDCPAK